MNEIIKKNGVTFGVIIGLTLILTTTLIYTIDLKYFTSWWIGLINLGIHAALSIFLMIKTKKDIGNVFPFKDAFKTYFYCALTAVSITVLFNVILFNIIDPGAKETIKELSINYAAELLQKFNAPAEKINETLKELQSVDQLSVGNLLKGGFSSLAISSIFGLLLAAIFKTKTSQSL